MVGPAAVKPHSVLQFSLSALCNLCNSNLDADSCCWLAFSLLSEHGCCVQLFKVQRSLKSTFVKTRKYFWMPTFDILFAPQSAVVWVSCHQKPAAKDSSTTCSEDLIEFIFLSSNMDSYSYFYRNHTSSTYDDEWTITKRRSGIVVTVSGTGASYSIYLLSGIHPVSRSCVMLRYWTVRGRTMAGGSNISTFNTITDNKYCQPFSTRSSFSRVNLHISFHGYLILTFRHLYC